MTVKRIIVFLFQCYSISAFAQLQIGPGTSWRSDNSTYVVLNNIGLQYDAATASLTNTFKFTGNADVNISGANQPIFTNIQLAKTGSAKVVLQRSFNLAQSLSFAGGLCDLNGNNIFLGTNAVLINENENSRIMGSDGYIRIINILNAPTAVNPGNLGAVITSAQNLGSVTIYRGVKSQVNNGGAGNSVLRFYEIVPTNNTGLNATLRFNYFDAELNGLTEANLVLYKSADNVNWSAQGYSGRDATLNYVEKSGINDFSRWTLSTPGNPLPVNFLLFTAECRNNMNSLYWKTSQEINVSNFNIQRSDDGISWVTIASLPAGGNTSTEHDYNYSDNGPAVATSLYRIAAVDADGRVKYTGIIRSACSGSVDIWKIWPNPVKHSAWISIQTVEPGMAAIKIFDGKGSLIRTLYRNLTNGNNLIELDMQKLTSGMYYIQAEWNNGKQRRSASLIKTD